MLAGAAFPFCSCYNNRKKYIVVLTSKSIVCIAVAFLSILQCTYYFSIILGDLATVIETKKESGLNQSRVNSFVGRLAQNNS